MAEPAVRPSNAGTTGRAPGAVRRRTVDVVVPAVLGVGAVQRSSRLERATDARGFDSGIPRSDARGSQLHRRDAWFVPRHRRHPCGRSDPRRPHRALVTGVRGMTLL